MKQLCLALVLLNVLFLFWQIHLGALNPAAPQPVSLTLQLVSEVNHARRGAAISALIDQQLEQQQQAALQQSLDNLRHQHPRIDPWAFLKLSRSSRPQALAKPALTVIRKCFEAGPFVTEPNARLWLAGKNLSSNSVLNKELALPLDFQVYYPAAKNPEQLRINKMMLNAKGVTDIWLVPDGENKGALSLGVFTDRLRASQFKDQLAQRGVQAELKQRFKTQPQWFAKVWLDPAKLQALRQQNVALAPCSGH